MRLINTETGKFEEFVDSSQAPLYAILSHTWEQLPKREQSYQDVVKIQQKYGLQSSESSLEEETLSNLQLSNPTPTLKTEAPTAPEPHTSTQSTPSSGLQLQHLSLTIFALLRSLLFWMVTRTLLYFLLSSSIFLLREPQVRAPIPEADLLDVQDPQTPSHTTLSIHQVPSSVSVADASTRIK